MRPVLSIDLICAGRAVLGARPEDRQVKAQALVSAAKFADKYRRQTGSVHPQFGDGTLAEAARLSGMASEPTVCDPDFADALMQVLRTLIITNSAIHRALQ